MPRTTALLGILMSLAPLACATTVRPGLANVPALGSSLVADASAHDVVANGRDSCERSLRPGPLRFQVPPCPGVVRGAPDPSVASRAPKAKGLVVPWVERYYSRWPCSSGEYEADRMTLARLAPPYAASDRALSGLTCARPL
jgi:hypothetical protein